jgi:serine/threonine-protein kinase
LVEKKPTAAKPRQPAAREEAREKKKSPLAFLPADHQPKQPAKPTGIGVIELAIAPWGEVYMDGERVGVSPPVNKLEAAPGKRKIEVRNGSFPAYTEVVEIKADQKVRIQHKFK